MNDAVLNFIRSAISARDVAGRSVLEVGSRNVNGSPRSVVEPMQPATYIGVDMESGTGVDQVLSVNALVDSFGEDAFEFVICTEMLEHVQDWRWAISQLKRVTAREGRLVVTTRSPGFPYHGYPHDFWRFTEADFKRIFADMEDVLVMSDPLAPGVFVAARKPEAFEELDLRSFEATPIHPAPVGLGLKQQLKTSIGIRWRRLTCRTRCSKPG